MFLQSAIQQAVDHFHLSTIEVDELVLVGRIGGAAGEELELTTDTLHLLSDATVALKRISRCKLPREVADAAQTRDHRWTIHIDAYVFIFLTPSIPPSIPLTSVW